MEDKNLKSILSQNPQFEKACQLIALLERDNFEAYIVGGSVRDAFLERELHDFDLATDAGPSDMFKIFKKFKTLDHGIEFGTLGVVVDGDQFEITTYRGEDSYTDKRHPDDVTFIKSKLEDLKRRDFTINAMMYHPVKGLYDPLNGFADLENKTLRAVGDPLERFEEDALRILRMFRFSISLGFNIERSSLEAACKSMPSLKGLSKERVFAEIDKALKKHVDFVKLKEAVLLFSQVFANHKVKQFEGSSIEAQEFSFKLPLYDFEKAHLIYTLGSDHLGLDQKTLDHYILSSSLKKHMNFLRALRGLPWEEFKISFVKKSDQLKMSGQELLRFWKVSSLHSNNHVKARAVLDGKILSYPSLDLQKSIDQTKLKKSGRALGDKIIELKVKSLFE